MRRTFTAIATIAILLVFTSSYNSYDVSVDINSFAPNFEISKLGNHFKLSETRGNYVIVNFGRRTMRKLASETFITTDFSNPSEKI